tara:strand:+ start:639 stop:905 length:267 start_codon:yes stop_codon:yes gene_type:complete
LSAYDRFEEKTEKTETVASKKPTSSWVFYQYNLHLTKNQLIKSISHIPVTIQQLFLKTHRAVVAELGVYVFMYQNDMHYTVNSVRTLL